MIINKNDRFYIRLHSKFDILWGLALTRCGVVDNSTNLCNFRTDRCKFSNQRPAYFRDLTRYPRKRISLAVMFP